MPKTLACESSNDTVSRSVPLRRNTAEPTSLIWNIERLSKRQFRILFTAGSQLIPDLIRPSIEMGGRWIGVCRNRANVFQSSLGVGSFFREEWPGQRNKAVRHSCTKNQDRSTVVCFPASTKCRKVMRQYGHKSVSGNCIEKRGGFRLRCRSARTLTRWPGRIPPSPRARGDS